MAKNIKAVPQGMHTITPHLVVRDATKAIEFYRKAFGADVQGSSLHSRQQGDAR